MFRAASRAALACSLLFPAAAAAQLPNQPPTVPVAAISYVPVPLIAPYQWLPAGVEACWRGLRDAPTTQLPAAPPAPALLDIRGVPADAVVVIDGQPQTVAGARLVVTVAPGGHLVRVIAPGRGSFTIDVQVEPGATAPVDVKLVPPTE
jgi:hypothetical protein